MMRIVSKRMCVGILLMVPSQAVVVLHSERTSFSLDVCHVAPPLVRRTSSSMIIIIMKWWLFYRRNLLTTSNDNKSRSSVPSLGVGPVSRACASVHGLVINGRLTVNKPLLQTILDTLGGVQCIVKDSITPNK